MSAITNPPPPIDFSNFEYTNLSSPFSIRLLSIIKRPRQLSPPSIFKEPLLECILETFNIHEAPDFDIISAVSGNPFTHHPGGIDEYGPMHRFPVAINGKIMFLPRNISEGLQMARDVNDPVEHRNEDRNQTKLIQAVEEDRLEDAKECLRQGAHVHAQDCYGKTAMHCAAENGNFYAVDELLDHGASMKVLDSAGRTPMDCFSYSRRRQWDQVADLAYRLRQDPEQRELVPAPDVIRVGRPIWIDAVCLNPNDPAERMNQSPMIPHIYSRASSIVAWTGVLEHSAKCSPKAIISHLTDDNSAAEDNAMMEDDSSDQDSSSDSEDDKTPAQLETSAKEFFSRCWFERSDLVHEVAFGRPITVYCGTKPIPLPKILEYLRKQKSSGTTFLPSELMVWSLIRSSGKKRTSDASEVVQKRSRR
ncbi:hypothetical protein BKA59DRAFT_456699 [Fusarium tricinctum]|uniref:Heterokaryon incompatibility domain-containing protein n=1 Tax=Fusarium tricinctum TaxID=61284 RepID=A0A8K0RUI1_9HYPO|nr:hypothetical protein BKA59DRAFT_456699 [Fusarium tricinctum]